MGSRDTELRRGVLEAAVLAKLAQSPAYGYGLTGALRELGFEDLVEGTVYTVLIRAERLGLIVATSEPSESGPPRKIYSLTEAGQARLDEFWNSWDTLTSQLGKLRKGE